jgi:hypothetical protein
MYSKQSNDNDMDTSYLQEVHVGNEYETGVKSLILGEECVDDFYNGQFENIPSFLMDLDQLLESTQGSTVGNQTQDLPDTFEETKECEIILNQAAAPNDDDALSSNGSQSSNGNSRGRPKENLNISSEDLLKFITQKLTNTLKKIETRENKVGNETRNRADVIRCAIYRAISKVPLWILNKLVSVGDRKHPSPDRLYESYSKAANGFLSIYKYLLATSSDATIVLKSNLAAVDNYTLKFSAIHFPMAKVSNVAIKFFKHTSDYVKDYSIEKSNPSLRKIAVLKQNNDVLEHLINFAKTIALQHGGFEKCVKAFDDLQSL